MLSCIKTSLLIGWSTLAVVSFSSDAPGSEECRLFAVAGNVTRDNITILAKNRDLYWKTQQRIWYSPRATHAEGDTIHFRNIFTPQCSLTYKFIVTNSIVKDQTAGYGINEYGVAIISHDMDSWDDDDLGTEYFHDQDYVALVLARCRTAAEAIALFNDIILPHGINAETYLIADRNDLWLLETTGFNYVAKPIRDGVVSSQHKRFNIRTEWSDSGNYHNDELLTNAAAHGCDTLSLDFAGCFGNLPPGVIDDDLMALKLRGDITVEDMRNLLKDKANSGTVSACVIPVRPGKAPRFFNLMWDSRADPEYGNVFLPFWIAISEAGLPDHYTSWPPDDGDCAWKKFSMITWDPAMYTAAEPIWQAWQAGLDTEFDSVETAMQDHLNAGDTLGMRSFVDEYTYRILDSAYDQAVDIIQKAGVPLPVADLRAAKAGEDLLLEWTAVTLDGLGNPVTVDHYSVFRETVPPARPGIQPVDTVDGCRYLDTTGVIGNPAVAYRYRLAALSGGKESVLSAPAGEFDREVIPGK